MVALRKESVDRNDEQTEQEFAENESLSARRAWIEMRVNEDRYGQQFVALRKESVDRNVMLFFAVSGVQSRSPQGERG